MNDKIKRVNYKIDRSHLEIYGTVIRLPIMNDCIVRRIIWRINLEVILVTSFVRRMYCCKYARYRERADREL